MYKIKEKVFVIYLNSKLLTLFSLTQEKELPLSRDVPIPCTFDDFPSLPYPQFVTIRYRDKYLKEGFKTKDPDEGLYD